ncbi:MAG: D-glycerate dehydrogenase [Litorilinea sp.]
MSKATVVVTRRIPAPALAYINEHCTMRLWDSDDSIPRATLLDWVQGSDGILCLLTEAINAELLEAAGPQLRVVSTMSVGFDHIDMEACRARGVQVGNTPGVLTETTADLTIALLLATARRLTEAHDAVRNGEWSTWQPEWMAGYDVYGSTVGIIGLGRIGMAFARRLAGFNCRLLYTNPTPAPGRAAEVGALYVEMDELLATSDFISIHCQLSPETRDLFNPDAFAKMKKSAILINTSRGGVVDQDALYTALTTGEIAGAGLDVTTPEPLLADHPLVALPNCLILPHIGSASHATRTKMALLAAQNLVAGVAGNSLPAAVG